MLLQEERIHGTDLGSLDRVTGLHKISTQGRRAQALGPGPLWAGRSWGTLLDPLEVAGRASLALADLSHSLVCRPDPGLLQALSTE